MIFSSIAYLCGSGQVHQPSWMTSFVLQNLVKLNCQSSLLLMVSVLYPFLNKCVCFFYTLILRRLDSKALVFECRLEILETLVLTHLLTKSPIQLDFD